MRRVDLDPDVEFKRTDFEVLSDRHIWRVTFQVLVNIMYRYTYMCVCIYIVYKDI